MHQADQGSPDSTAATDSPQPQTNGVSAPAIALPKGGGAIRGIGEKFAANPVTGTGSMSVPIATSPGRSGFGPQLSLSYDSGAGNGPFGFGWSLALPSITRKTDKGLPRYQDAAESDVFILSGAEDLVPVLDVDGKRIVDTTTATGYRIEPYRPRIEGLFARIERWTNVTDPTDVHWRSWSRDNVLTLYGKDRNSRITDPGDPRRIFSWRICETRDTKGNGVLYAYKFEDVAKVELHRAHERNRGDKHRSANSYLKQIRYGNRVPLLTSAGQRPRFLTQAMIDEAAWCFEVVLDYGEHNDNTPIPAEQPNTRQWHCRSDPFSTHRSGFELRTYRLCRRVLMFHHFPGEPGVGQDCLVRSTDLQYRESPIASFITAVTHSGYRRTGATYLMRSLPALEFTYSEANVDGTIRDVVDSDTLENLPVGVDDAAYRWVDLDGEGIAGVLTEQAGAWFYKPGLGGGRLGPLQAVSRTPSLAALGDGGQQLMDLAGDGSLDLAAFGAPTPGYYERTQDDDWEAFRAFASLPNVAWDDPNLRFVDLNGDGHADILVTEQDAFTWYPSLGEDGFGASSRVHQQRDEELGPTLVFADGTQQIYLADMCGDGLNDLARIRNGEVCYWPNLGYGRFGAKVAMDNAPLFDAPDQFNQQRLRLADIDGSGAIDLIYLGRDAVRLYFNQAGNTWADARALPQLPQVDNVAAVSVTDLLGNGTACLVWSSPLPNDTGRQMRYIDLMGGQKPYLLVLTVNNLGAETRVRYASSTTFYTRDKAAGRPWITRLPFPVHVIERIEVYDRISRNRFVTRYAYHHGHFDGVEREMCGFAMVEQWDTENFAALTQSGDLPVGDNIDAASHVPPVHTKTWFHTGVYLGRTRVSHFFAGLTDDNDIGEYYREPAWRDDDNEARERLLDDTVLPPGLTLEEEAEACRALKGSMLRQEVYAQDGTEKATDPYIVTEQHFGIRLLQGRRRANRHAIFLAHSREVITYHYERDPKDPRIAHTLTLEVDRFGNTLKQAAVAYGRRKPDESLPLVDRLMQTKRLVTYTETVLTKPLVGDEHYAPMPAEARTYELTGYPLVGRYFQHSDLVKPDPRDETRRLHDFDEEIDYDDAATTGRQRRLIAHVRTLYRRNDMTGLLTLGTLESLALPGESYELAFTPKLLDRVFKRPSEGQPLEDLIPDRVTMLGNASGYVNLDGDGRWWIPGGRTFHSPDSTHTAAQELAHARGHFFLAKRYRDPFSNTSTVTFDQHHLLMRETRDPLDNRVTVGERKPNGAIDNTKPGNDYRVLQPWRVMDPNRNRTQVAFDALGMVVGTAVMGKPEENLGDSLVGFEDDLSPATVLDHMDRPLDDPLGILQRASTRLIYDVLAYQRTKNQSNPQAVVGYTMARETHHADPGGSEPKVQHAMSYSDGFGREIQKKIQADPGPVPRRNITGAIIVNPDGQPAMTRDEVTPRWVGSGWTVFNNKGNPIRQYDPFFSDRHDFEFGARVGVSPILFYDPVERVVATLHPNHTWEKVVFGPWRKETWDASDTVLVGDPSTDADVGDFFDRLSEAAYLPTWHTQRKGALGEPRERAAADKASIHRETPTVAYADSLGRTFLTIVHNRFKYSDTPAAALPGESFHQTRLNLDIEGNQREVVDAKDRVVVQYAYDLLGNRIHQQSMEAGQKWTLNDISAKPVYIWDIRGHRFRTAYDRLRRSTASFLSEGTTAEMLVGSTVYGEARSRPQANNLRGKVVELSDQAGLVTTDNYDFKGNSLRGERQLAHEYKATVDWLTVVALEAATYISLSRYDALNRPIELTAPDNTIIRPTYNQANLLVRVDANLSGATVNGQRVWTQFISDIDYDEKGKRTLVDYGNGVTTTYSYDRLTTLLVHLVTRRNVTDYPDDCPQPSPVGWLGCQVQNLQYTYDPVGNITHIRDAAQQTVFFRNRRIEPSAEYTYDAIHRLIEATGREHLGQAAGAPSSQSYNDGLRAGLPHPGDGNVMGRYLERYVYDEVGNFDEMGHPGAWTRRYAYNEPSALEPGRRSNRLTSSTVTRGPTESYSIGADGYDSHGNMLRMSHLHLMQWDSNNQLQMTQRQVVNAADLDGKEHHGERTWHVYDAAGHRTRTVTELATGQVKDERVYLGGFEVYRSHGANALVRETLHVAGGEQRVALVETRVHGAEPGVPSRLFRYQLGNHIGSSNLELNHAAQILSYEEYTPYGSTSYQAVRSQTQTPKRLRFSGRERLESSGLIDFGARFYIPWLGRWTAPEPSGIRDGTNLYEFVRGNPVVHVELDGHGLGDFASGAAKGFAFGFVAGVGVAALLATAPISGTALLVIGAVGLATTAVTAMKVNRDLASGKITPAEAHYRYGEIVGGLVGGAAGGGFTKGLEGLASSMADTASLPALVPAGLAPGVSAAPAVSGAAMSTAAPTVVGAATGVVVAAATSCGPPAPAKPNDSDQPAPAPAGGPQTSSGGPAASTPLPQTSTGTVNAPKVGKGQVTGPGHAETSERIATEFAKQPEVELVTLNKAYRTISGVASDPLRRPDVGVRDVDKVITSVEVVSKTDSVLNLAARNLKAQLRLPADKRGGVFVVPIDAKPTP